MNTKSILRGGIAALMCLSLGACLGSSGGGGLAGGAGGGGTYDANLSRVQNLGPQTIRQSGVVNYAGQTNLVTNGGAGGAVNGFFVGDLTFAADFDNGTFDGTATNFAGEVDGTAVTLAGTLLSSNAPASNPNIVVQTTVPIPVVGGTVTTGSLIGTMRGTLTESVNNQSTTAELTTTGSFVGANATGATGTAAMLLNNTGGVGFTFGGGGTFYADRQ